MQAILIFLMATAAWASSDSFTAANGTALATHDSNWAGTNVGGCVIQSNQLTTTSVWAQCDAYYSTSTADTSQVVVKAYTDTDKGPAVRMSSGARGYRVLFNGYSGGNWTGFKFLKNEAWLDQQGCGNFSQSVDHTIKLVASGTSTVTLSVYVDGTYCTGTSDSSSPITSGHPGFVQMGNGNATNLYVDDWTDGVASAVAAPGLVRPVWIQ